jgi:hypothetical protein
MQTAKWAARIGAGFYVLWGIFHFPWTAMPGSLPRNRSTDRRNREMGRLKPLGAPPVDVWTTQRALPTWSTGLINSKRSGQMMCYINRTT